MGEIQHGVSACYSNGPDGYQPVIICTCGWCERDTSWREVGERYDEHLADVKRNKAALLDADETGDKP